MKFHFCTNRRFQKAVLVTQGKFAVLSMYSEKLNNLGKDRWEMRYKGKSFYKNNNELQRFLKDSMPYQLPSIKFTSGGKKIKGTISNLMYNTSSNLKNNNSKKYFLVFYINLEKLGPLDKKAYNLKNISIKIKSKVLQGPRFQYGYCDDFKYRPCELMDYVKEKRYVEGILTGASQCMVFDHEKGPFNMYCAGST